MSKNDPAEGTVRDIRRKTRKQYTAEEKIRIVVWGLRGEESIAAVNGGAKLVHPGGAKLVHLTLCGTRCWGVVPVVHRRDPRCFE